MDKLSPENFPLRAIGVNIYAQMWSSPILVADSPQTAETVTAWLNEFAQLKARVVRDGPVLVAPPSSGMLEI